MTSAKIRLYGEVIKHIQVSEKLSKYKDLETEITCIWQMRTVVIPIVVGALELLKKALNSISANCQAVTTYRKSKKQHLREQHTL